MSKIIAFYAMYKLNCMVPYDM